MKNSDWNRIRSLFDINLEHLRIYLSKLRLLFVLLVICLVSIFSHFIVRDNWEFVKTIYKESALVGVIGTLLGAVVGGLFSFVGSVYVNNRQIKIQAEIRRKNQIYTPLYDELTKIHTSILKEHPYPNYIDFEKQQQTVPPRPQFITWRCIKSDSRYLETPIKLVRAMDSLEKNVLAYQGTRKKVNEITLEILNEILDTDLGVRYGVSNMGFYVAGEVLLGHYSNLSTMLRQGIFPRQEIDNDAWQKAQDDFVKAFQKNSDVIHLKKQYIAWQESEEIAISLLKAMICRINASYEGQ